MNVVRLLVQPRRLLAGATVVLAAFGLVWAFAEYDGALPTSTVLLLPVVVLAVLGATNESAGRGWLYILGAWAFGFVAYGALYPAA